MGLLSRLAFWKGRSTEGAYRPGPWFLSDGWLSGTSGATGRASNWWQMGGSLQPYTAENPMVEACIGAYSQTIPMCPGDHWRTNDDGGRERVTNSALSRFLKRPNDYQSISDFLLNLTRRLYAGGEVFGLAVRNARFEIEQIHLMRHGYPRLAVDGSIFYDLSGNEIAEQRFDLSKPIPARDVLHIRLHTPVHPLRGVSPILSNALSLALSGAALNQQVAFYLNQARPSFMLETDAKLTLPQSRELRQFWDEQTKGERAGGTPILTNGLKAKSVTSTPKDGQLAELLKMSREDVALAYRMPLQVLGIGDTPFASTEALMSAWKASGLGFALNHIEEAVGLLFGLKGQPEEYLEFDTDALMRSAFKDYIEGLARGVISGVFAPDEARAKVALPRVKGGHGAMPRVQQQVVPLSYGTEMKPPDPSAAPVAPQEPGPTDDEGDDDDSDRNVVEFSARDLIAAADEIDRRVAA